MNKNLLFISAVFGLLAVVIGAFAAHGLKPHLSAQAMQWMETGNRYHFYHTLAALLAVFIQSKIESRWLKFSAIAFLVGIVLFSGSLYIMAVTGITKLGMITPIGGLSFIAGWLMLAMGTFKKSF